MKKICLFIMAAILTGAYVYADSEHPMDKALQTWEGVKIKELVKAWGNPTNIVYEQGQTKYLWEESKGRFIPGTDYQKKVDCNKIFIVDTSGVIVYAKHAGDGCPFTTESAKEYSNTIIKVKK